MAANTSPIDCACLIHGSGYSWQYVDTLYSMLSRNLSRPVTLHVYTEASRTVPAPYIKHELEDWKISGPKKSWWYKLQLFNPAQFSGPLLYFDLDVVIARNIDWIWQLKNNYFWTVHDFKRIYKPAHQGLNSSIMWWDTQRFQSVWTSFKQLDFGYVLRKYPGDQDFLSQIIPQSQRRYFNSEWVKSWRWQCLDGGYNFKSRTWAVPGQGTVIPSDTSVLVFHGDPKPAQITDPVIQQYWK